MIYAKFGENGRVVLTVNDSTIDDVPEWCYEITEDQLNNKFDLLLVDGEITEHPLQPQDPIIPTVVTMRQARLALLQADLLTAVNDAVAQMPTQAQIEWEYATSVDRNSPLVGGLAAMLSLDAEALDELFLSAGQL